MNGSSINYQSIVFKIGANSAGKITVNGIILKQRSSFVQNSLIHFSANHDCAKTKLISLSGTGHKLTRKQAANSSETVEHHIFWNDVFGFLGVFQFIGNKCQCV